MQQNQPTRNSSRLLPLLCLIGGGTLIGLSTNLVKIAASYQLSPLAFLNWSILGAAVLLLIINIWKKDFPPLNRSVITYYILAALIGISVPYLLLYVSVPHVGAGFVSLAIAFPPFYTYLGALIWRVESFRWPRAIGVLCALSGVAFLAFFKLSTPNAPIIWIILTLLAPIILAVGNIYRTLYWPHQVKPNQLVSGILFFSAIFLFPASLIPIPEFSLYVPMENFQPVLLISVQIGVFAGQYLLLLVLQKVGGPVYMSLLGSVGALTGVPVAVLLLKEDLPRGLAVSSVLIVIGITLVSMRKPKSA